MNPITVNAQSVPTDEQIANSPKPVQHVAGALQSSLRRDVVIGFREGQSRFFAGDPSHLGFVLGMQFALQILMAEPAAPEGAPRDAQVH